MSLKYLGDKKDFIKILNNAFNQNIKGKQVGNAFRYSYRTKVLFII